MHRHLKKQFASRHWNQTVLRQQVHQPKSAHTQRDQVLPPHSSHSLHTPQPISEPSESLTHCPHPSPSIATTFSFHVLPSIGLQCCSELLQNGFHKHEQLQNHPSPHSHLHCQFDSHLRLLPKSVNGVPQKTHWAHRGSWPVICKARSPKFNFEQTHVWADAA